MYTPGSRPHSYRRRQCSRNSGPKIGSMNNAVKLHVRCNPFPSVVNLIIVFWDSYISDVSSIHIIVFPFLSRPTKCRIFNALISFGDFTGLVNTYCYLSAGAKSTFGGSIVQDLLQFFILSIS